MSAKVTTRRPQKRAKGGPRTYGRLQRALDEAAKREIEAALKESGGNITHSAESLGITRVSLRKRMADLGIKPS